MKDIESGEEFTTAFVDLEQNKSDRNKNLSLLLIKECNCDKCRLNLDKDFDYRGFGAIISIHAKHWSSMGLLPLNYFKSRNYFMDKDFMADFRQIYGENDPLMAEMLVLSFICFTKFSKDSNIISVTLWYQKISKMVAITHGKAHPLYKLVTDLYWAPILKLLHKSMKTFAIIIIIFVVIQTILL